MCSSSVYRLTAFNYRIYSINHPGRLLHFWTLRVSGYSRWALIRGWALIKCSPFSASEVCFFCNKTINGNNKCEEVTKQGFCKILSEKSFIRIHSAQVGGVGVSAYLSLIGRRRGWAFIRGWALINFFCL